MYNCSNWDMPIKGNSGLTAAAFRPSLIRSDDLVSSYIFHASESSKYFHEQPLFSKGGGIMACTFYVEVKGIEFAFHFGLGSGDGVVVEPGLQDINSPEFIPALQEALRIYPTLNAVIALENYAHAYANKNYTDAQLKNHFYGAPDDHVADIIRWYETAKNQDHLEVTPIMVRYAEAAIWEKERQAKKLAKEQHKVQRRVGAVYKGYVYLLQSATGAYKIGRTKNPKDRMKTFSVKLPFEVEYICIIQTDDMYGLEQSLHDQFANKRLNGEWFNLTPEDVEHIKGLAQ